jgi:hypothetical protein
MYAGVTLFQLPRWEDAERAAKAAVTLDPGNRLARLLLSRIQAVRRETTN